MYRRQAESLDFYHTYVPESFRNQGLAKKVVEAGFLYAKEHRLKVIPTCPYVSTLVSRKRTEFLPLLQSP